MSQLFKLGMNAKIYQGAAEADLVDLVEMSNVKDVTLSMEAGEADMTTRANSGWRATAPTLRECTESSRCSGSPAKSDSRPFGTPFSPPAEPCNTSPQTTSRRRMRRSSYRDRPNGSPPPPLPCSASPPDNNRKKLPPESLLNSTNSECSWNP